MNNTTVKIKYSNGSTREFVASDELEKSINNGEMFSVTTMHSDMGADEEAALSKMYAGNPMNALGHMMMMKRNAENMVAEEPEMSVAVSILTACISLLSNEITSDGSGMSMPSYEQVVDRADREDKVGEGQYRCEMCQGVFDEGWSDEEAHKEADANGLDPAECGICCDDCYKKTSYYTPPDEEGHKCPAINAPCEHFAEPCDGELVYCTHPDNSDKDHVGNCTSFLCPLCTNGGG
jgi:hypothetical protein